MTLAGAAARFQTEENPMKPIRSTVLPVLACLSLALPALAGTLKCPPDSVKVGTVCIDTYEASVWQLPAGSRLLTKFSVQRQKAGRPPGAPAVARQAGRSVRVDASGSGVHPDGRAGRGSLRGAVPHALAQ